MRPWQHHQIFILQTLFHKNTTSSILCQNNYSFGSQYRVTSAITGCFMLQVTLCGEETFWLCHHLCVTQYIPPRFTNFGKNAILPPEENITLGVAELRKHLSWIKLQSISFCDVFYKESYYVVGKVRALNWRRMCLCTFSLCKTELCFSLPLNWFKSPTMWLVMVSVGWWFNLPYCYGFTF